MEQESITSSNFTFKIVQIMNYFLENESVASTFIDISRYDSRRDELEFVCAPELLPEDFERGSEIQQRYMRWFSILAFFNEIEIPHESMPSKLTDLNLLDPNEFETTMNLILKVWVELYYIEHDINDEDEMEMNRYAPMRSAGYYAIKSLSQNLPGCFLDRLMKYSICKLYKFGGSFSPSIILTKRKDRKEMILSYDIVFNNISAVIGRGVDPCVLSNDNIAWFIKIKLIIELESENCFQFKVGKCRIMVICHGFNPEFINRNKMKELIKSKKKDTKKLLKTNLTPSVKTQIKKNAKIISKNPTIIEEEIYNKLLNFLTEMAGEIGETTTNFRNITIQEENSLRDSQSKVPIGLRNELGIINNKLDLILRKLNC